MFVDLLEDVQKPEKLLRPVLNDLRGGQPGDLVMVSIKGQTNTLANFREPVGRLVGGRRHAIHPPEACCGGHS